MAFANGTTELYLPIAASAGSSLWGSDVRKVLSSPDATADTTTICNHGTTASAQNRTCDPYTTSTADLTEADYGWTIQPTDMGSVSGAERMIPAGNHVLTAQVSTNSVLGSNVDVKFSAYRVGPAAGRTRTLLGTVTEAETFPNAGGSITVTLALSEIVFANDETIAYSLEFSSPGVVITGKTTTLHTGTSGGTETRVTIPGLKTIAQTSSGMTGAGVLAAAAGIVLGMGSAMTGSGVLAATLGATAGTSSGMTGTGALAAGMSSIAGTSVTMAGVGELNPAMGKILGTSSEMTVSGGGGDTFIRPIFVFDD